MPRHSVIWINADASARRAGDYTLAFAPDTVFNFATADALRACTEEIVAVLQRYGVACRLHEP